MSKSALPLIVAADDEASILQLLERKIEHWGLRYQGAANREQLLSILDHEPPSLLILDLHFGSSNGIDMLGELREMHPDVQIVLLTGHATVADAVAAIMCGHMAIPCCSMPYTAGRSRRTLNFWPCFDS